MTEGGDKAGRGNVVAFIGPTTAQRRCRSEYKAWDNACRRARQGFCQVDPSWLGRGGFDQFLKDVGPKPTAEHSLDRVDPADPRYGPGLVRWATKKTQTRNRKTTIRLTDSKGETRSLGEWAEVAGVPYDTMLRRHRRGWTADEVIHGRDRAQAKFDTAVARLPWPLLPKNKIMWEQFWRKEGRRGESRGEFFRRKTMLFRMLAWEELAPYRPMYPDQQPDEAPKPPAELVARFEQTTVNLERASVMIHEERRREAERRERELRRQIMRYVAKEFPGEADENEIEHDESDWGEED